MAENTPPLFPLPKPTLKHLRLPARPSRVDYKGRGNGKRSIRSIDRADHAGYLSNQLDAVSDWIAESIPGEDIEEMTGIPVELITKSGFPLSTEDIHGLTTHKGKQHGPLPIHLHSQQLVDAEGKHYTRVLLNVPFGGLGVLQEKVRKFGAGRGVKGNLPYFANIDSISPAAIKGLWTDPLENLPDDDQPHWWQFWVRKYPEENRARFIEIARTINIQINGDDLSLPEHYVFVGHCSRSTLESSIPLLDTLSELRGAHAYSLDLTDLTSVEQQEYVNLALERIAFPGAAAPAVCLLDTGVNRGHRLLANLLDPSDCDTVWGDRDGSDGYVKKMLHGHGTPMAGLAAYGDLRRLVESSETWQQLHRLESVRLYDPARPNTPANHGKITRQAISRPEINAPNRQRTYCLAITAPGTDDGKPSAWSAAVDMAAYGESTGRKRLLIVSTGNVSPEKVGPGYAYPDENRQTPIEDPAQAWNAVTVGALTRLTNISIKDDDDESRRLSPIVREPGRLSPFSRTSCDWDPHWPIKPEIVLEGGNAAMHPQHGVDHPESLQLCSTSAFVSSGKAFCTFKATSAATALAARHATELTARYPDFWPETIRGLLVHSAKWSPAMLDGIDPHKSYTKVKRQQFIQSLRSYGYGEPDFGRAAFSAPHATTMIREDQLHPYKKDGSTIKLNDCHIHHLPWPKKLLQDNFAATLTLRITLSYFIAPNPSANNALKGSRYRYAGSLLRFLVRNKEDSDDARFEARLTRAAKAASESDESIKEDVLKPDPGWALGSQLCGKGGSLIHDVWRGTAADLLQMDRIAVFPAKGWWAYRKPRQGDEWHGCHALPIRYSLVVSIEAEQDIPLYSEISNILSVTLNA